MRPRSPGRGKTPKQPPSSVEEGADWLRAYAVQMHDKGDGHGVDWAVVAQTMFAAAFGTLDQEQAADRALKVLRRVEVSVYDRLARNADDTPSPRLTDGPGAASAPAPAPKLPEPRNRP